MTRQARPASSVPPPASTGRRISPGVIILAVALVGSLAYLLYAITVRDPSHLHGLVAYLASINAELISITPVVPTDIACPTTSPTTQPTTHPTTRQNTHPRSTS